MVPAKCFACALALLIIFTGHGAARQFRGETRPAAGSTGPRTRPSRSLLTGSAANKDKDVLTVTSNRVIAAEEPASAKTAPTKTTTYVGDVECTLNSVPAAATNTAHNVLKCVKKPGAGASNIVAITGSNAADVPAAGALGAAQKTAIPGVARPSLSSFFKRPAAGKPAGPNPSSVSASAVASTHPGYVILKDSPAPSPANAPNAASPQNTPSANKASPAAGYVIIKDSPAPSPVNTPNVPPPQPSPTVVLASPAVVSSPAAQNDLAPEDDSAADNSGVDASTADSFPSDSPNNLPKDPSEDALDNFPGDSPFDVPPLNGANNSLNDILPQDSPAVVRAFPAVVPPPVNAQPSPAAVKASPAVVPSPAAPQPSPAAVPSPVPLSSNVVNNAVPVPTAAINAHDTEVLHTAINRFGSRWELAPVCKTKPSKQTAVQDTMGRLWWFEDGMSCAYRNVQGASMFYDGYIQVKWETAHSCKAIPTLINAMADAEGRLWGWTGAGTADGDNCKFVDAAGKAVKQENILEQIIHLAAAESTELN